MSIGQVQQVLRDRAVYQQVAVLHAENIDQGFLSSLGARFLALLYRAIDENEDSVLIVEIVNDQVVGFVSGSRGTGHLFRWLLRKWLLLSLALLPLVFQPRKIIGIFEVLRHSLKPAESDQLPEHELLSIAVAPEFRGKGYAEHLYRKLEDHFRGRNVPSFKIVVGESLLSAHRFYQRMGAQPSSSVEVHSGESSTIYVHELG